MIELDSETIRLAREGRDVFYLYHLKRALEKYPVEEAFAEYCRVLDIDGRVELSPVAASSMHAMARTRAKVYHETDPGGWPYINAAPKVVGSGNHRDLEWISRAAYVACFANARIWGVSSCIELSDAVLLDFEDWELAQTDDQLFLDIRIFR